MNTILQRCVGVSFTGFFGYGGWRLSSIVEERGVVEKLQREWNNCPYYDDFTQIRWEWYK